MKLRIASDFHLEFYTYKSFAQHNGRDMHESFVLPVMDNEKEQILLLAGDIQRAVDIQNNRSMKFFFDAISDRFNKVFFIAGNHEHYGFNFNNTIPVLRDFYARYPNFYFGDNDMYMLDDETALFAGTLWTDFSNDPNAMIYAMKAMGDFAGAITKPLGDHSARRYTPQDSVNEHEWAMQRIIHFNKEYADKKRVIMTHHAPSAKSTGKRFEGSLLNPAFRTELDEYILDTQPHLWVHGHMHNSSDYMIGNTRILCNPYGYYSENDKDYNPKLVVEI